jgi:hypothetical protein
MRLHSLRQISMSLLCVCIALFCAPMSLMAQGQSVPEIIFPLIRAVQDVEARRQSSARTISPLRVYRLTQGLNEDQSTVSRQNSAEIFRAFPAAAKRTRIQMLVDEAHVTNCASVRDIATCIATEDMLVFARPEMVMFKNNLQVIIQLFRATRGSAPLPSGIYFANVIQETGGAWVLVPGSLMAIAH